MQDLPRFPAIEHERPPSDDPRFSREELQLAFRNRGMPLEALRFPVTPAGLHYLLTHFDIPVAGPGWRLEIGGLVAEPLALELADIKARPAITRRVTLECAGNGRALMSPRPVSQPWLDGAVSTAEWTGTPLRSLLEQARVRPEATEVVFTGADIGMEAGEVQRYQRSLRLADALSDDVLLAYRMNDAPLPPQHGFPLRLVVPGWYGMASVKWLARIELIDRPFEGHYMVGTYRYTQKKEERGEPVSWQQVRALMVPPGIPDYYSRTRLVQAGEVLLEGRAWAGPHAVAKVEVSSDGGQRWQDAQLEPPLEPCCWQAWRCAWHSVPGRHTLMVRASDANGAVQPLEPVWNRHGMGNNVVQRVEVVVA
jgi:sulfane dehydrogenase subunit SoxC